MNIFLLTINQKHENGETGFFYNEYLTAKSKLELVKNWRKTNKDELESFIIMNIEDLGEGTEEDIKELNAEKSDKWL